MYLVSVGQQGKNKGAIIMAATIKTAISYLWAAKIFSTFLGKQGT